MHADQAMLKQIADLEARSEQQVKQLGVKSQQLQDEKAAATQLRATNENYEASLGCVEVDCGELW